MSKTRTHRQEALRARARRQGALERTELRQPSEQRDAAVGATSYPIKRQDPALAAMIAEALARKSGGV